MNKKFFITLIIILSNSILFAQAYYSKEWLVGLYGVYSKINNSSITFDTANIVSLITNTPFQASKSNICDTNGNVQLIADGLNIYDRNGFAIEGGDSLCSDYYYLFQNKYSHFGQTGFFLPMDSGKCYFINVVSTEQNINDVWFGSQYNGRLSLDVLQYSVVDMYGNNGIGKVTKRNIPLVENAKLSRTQMMACRHGNGKDWWLLKKALDSNNVYTFLVTQDSIYNKGIQRMPFAQNGLNDNIGQMMFNNDGTQIATAQNDLLGIVYMADFDRCYGTLSNYKKIQVPAQPSGPVLDSTTTGVCFSPNNQFLYVAKYDHILQYNLTDNTWYYVHYKDTIDAEFQGYNTMYLAPNNKIYIGNWNGFSKQMSVIDSPDGAGTNCNFCRKCFRSPKVIDGWLSNAPCMPNYSLGSMPGCATVGVSAFNSSKEEFEVYPNPTQSKFKIKIKNPNSKKELYNSIGQLVLSTKENEIDVRNLSKGIYYLKVGNVSKKVIVE